MVRHETPIRIANELARHAPGRIRRLLDPAVGTGVLLEPFLSPKTKAQYEVFAIDRDPKPLAKLDQQFGVRCRKFQTIADDFLSWARSFRAKKLDPFDCVVMNPPFSSRRSQWISFDPIRDIPGCQDAPGKGPIEAAFVLMAIELLRNRGRLLAILPASLITTPTFDWVRRAMALKNTIHQVHELPRFAFPGIGSRIYLLVLEKGRRSTRTLLLNHDLSEPDRRSVSRTNLSERLDFAYHHANAAFRRVKRDRQFGWLRLGKTATVFRGSESTPGIPISVVHSTDFVNGFWKKDRSRQKKRAIKGNKVRVEDGDILVKRVSRDCARTFGSSVGLDGHLCSDCVLIIRPLVKRDHMKLLFCLRCLFELEFMTALVEKGTGAAYLSKEGLKNLSIPLGLAERFPGYFRRYSAAAKRRDFLSMVQIERTAAESIRKRRGGEAKSRRKSIQSV